MNHLRENFGSSKTLRPRGVRNAGTGGIVTDGTGPVFLLQMGNDGDDELCLEYKKNTDMTSSSFALFLFAFSSSTSSSANPSLTSAKPKVDENADSCFTGVSTGISTQNTLQKVARFDIAMNNPFRVDLLNCEKKVSHIILHLRGKATRKHPLP